MEIIENSIEYIKSETKPELKFTWKSTPSHPDSVRQVVKLFSKVNVSLLKHESDPFKYNVRVVWKIFFTKLNLNLIFLKIR